MADLEAAALLAARILTVCLALWAGTAVWQAERGQEDQGAATAMLGGITALAGVVLWLTAGGPRCPGEGAIVCVALWALFWGVRRYAGGRCPPGGECASRREATWRPREGKETVR